MPFPTPFLPIAVEALLGGWIHLYFLVNFLKNQAISFHKWFRLKAVLHLATQHYLIGTRCFASFILRNIVRETLHSLPCHRVIILTRFVRKQSHAIHNNDIWKAKLQNPCHLCWSLLILRLCRPTSYRVDIIPLTIPSFKYKATQFQSGIQRRVQS